MLFTENLLEFFRLHVKLQGIYGTCPFTQEFETSSKGFPHYKLYPPTSQSLKWQQFKLSQVMLWGAIVWFQMLHGRGLRSPLITMECLLYCTSIIAFIVTKRTVIQRHTMAIECFNLLLQFEKRHLQDSPFLPEMALTKSDNWMIRLTQVAGIVTSVTLPVGYALQRLLDNCSPSTFAYFVLPHCKFPTTDNGYPNFDFESIWKLVLIMILSLWLFLDMIGFFCFFVFELSLLPGYCFRYYMQFFRKSLSYHFNKRGRSSKNSNFPIYREIQLLSRFYNLLQQDKIVVGILDIVLLAVIICFYALISYGSNVSIPHLFLFSSALLNGLLGITVCFGTFGRVHGDSLEILAFLKSKVIPQVAPQEHKYLVRYIASLQPIKVRLGNVNFVDNLTPIVLLHFCFSQIVNLVML